MMTGREKLYFLLDAINDIRELTPSGEPIKIHPTRNLNQKYNKDELVGLLTKLEKDDKVIKIVQVPNPNAGYLTNEKDYILELLPNFDNYYSTIQFENGYQEFTGKTPTKRQSSPVLNLSALHPDICNKCQSLFEKAEYPEAVEKSFKVVRDKLRDLTGYETGSEAFGKGKLHIKGAAASNVDADFNEGVKFLTMAIDKFRNEKSHTSIANLHDPQQAYEYLSISSRAMHFLDQAESTSRQ